MSDRSRYLPLSLFALVLFFLAAVPLRAQTEEELVKAVTEVGRLFKAGNQGAAVPHLEMLIKALPEDPELRFAYGVSLLARSKQVDAPAEGKKFSDRALEQFREAKKLGYKDPQNDALIALLTGATPPASDKPAYSKVRAAEEAMHRAESFFAQSKYDEALKLYEQALSLDPKIYEAGVFAGDAYLSKGDFENAEKWYQKAIAIDPNRETAWRYSGTPLMRQKKFDLAKERYIEAVVAEPYNSYSHRGIQQWSQATQKKLAHPSISVPELTFDANGKATPKTAIDAKDAAKSPWLAYIATRETWRSKKFAAAFPKEKDFRHTLTEEVEALRAALAATATGGSPSDEFKLLSKIDKEGLLEAFVLLSAADEGTALDHPAYRATDRAKLKQYVANYLIQK